MSKNETRTIAISELRAVDTETDPIIEGYAAVFNEVSQNLGGFVERIEPGAFAETLAADPDVSANVEHERGLMTIGRTRNGSLMLTEDSRGLRARIKPPDTAAGRDAVTLVRGGYIDQMSFNFQVITEEWKDPEDSRSLPLRRLLAVSLDGGDVTLTGRPAYPQTSAEARAMAKSLQPADPDPLIDENDPAGEAAGADALNDGTPGGDLNLMRLRLSETED